jgi:hypothetical protein
MSVTKRQSRARAEEGQILVTRTRINNLTKEVLDQSEETEKILVRPFAADVAHVGGSFKVKHNMGNYESTEIGAFVSLPCYLEESVEVLDQAIELAKAVVARESALIEEYKE